MTLYDDNEDGLHIRLGRECFASMEILPNTKIDSEILDWHC